MRRYSRAISLPFVAGGSIESDVKNLFTTDVVFLILKLVRRHGVPPDEDSVIGRNRRRGYSFNPQVSPTPRTFPTRIHFLIFRAVGRAYSQLPVCGVACGSECARVFSVRFSVSQTDRILVQLQEEHSNVAIRKRNAASRSSHR